MRWCFDDIEVYIADDRESALSYLRRIEPQVITLDLGLPPDPGGSTEVFALLDEILRLAPNTKIIVVTGREEKENAGLCPAFFIETWSRARRAPTGPRSSSKKLRS